MKNLTLLLAMAGLFLLPFSLLAQELGLDSTTKLTLDQQNSLLFGLSERLDGWFKVPMDANGSLFEGSGHLGILMDVDSRQGVSGIPTGDIDLLRVAFLFPQLTPDMKTMNFEFGRLRIQDPTGLILDHAADGLMLGFNYPDLSISFRAGYTGFLLRNANDQTIDISLSHTDEAIAADKTRVFGTQRFLILAQIDFPDIFKQDLNVSFLAQQDMNPDSKFLAEGTTVQDPTRGGALDNQYLTVQLGGPIVETLFYNVWFTYGFGRTLSWINATGSYQYKPISAFLTGFNMDFYLPSALKSAFKARFILASGDPDYSSSIEGNTNDLGTQFNPVTITTLGTVFSPALSNLIVAQLGYSLQPIANVHLQTGVNVFGFFRPTPQPALDPFPGIEIDIFGNYRLTSDLGLSLSGGLLIPGSAGQSLRYSIQLALNLAI